MKPMLVFVKDIDDKGNVQLTKEELEKLIFDAYDQGVEDGKRFNNLTYPSPLNGGICYREIETTPGIKSPTGINPNPCLENIINCSVPSDTPPKKDWAGVRAADFDNTHSSIGYDIEKSGCVTTAYS